MYWRHIWVADPAKARGTPDRIVPCHACDKEKHGMIRMLGMAFQLAAQCLSPAVYALG